MRTERRVRNPVTITRWTCPACGYEPKGDYVVDESPGRCTRAVHRSRPRPAEYVNADVLYSDEVLDTVIAALQRSDTPPARWDLRSALRATLSETAATERRTGTPAPTSSGTPPTPGAAAA